jgi:cytochrome c556
MSRTFLSLSTLFILIVAGAGLAKAAPPELRPEQYVAARQASLDMSTFVRGSMQSAMQSGLEARSQGYAAQSLARWAKVLPTLFPAGTGEGQTAAKTQARPAVWADRAGFEAAAARYAEATEQLLARAQANDTEGFKAQLAAVGKACDACHAVYKDGPQTAPPK